MLRHVLGRDSRGYGDGVGKELIEKECAQGIEWRSRGGGGEESRLEKRKAAGREVSDEKGGSGGRVAGKKLMG
jgi:hypothetical protein